uniref:Protein kinase domain-containing protein n=1 Tax=Macrostomum lignano TaxID=282301 RepID=A0A1I8I6V5_9PLAT
QLCPLIDSNMELTVGGYKYFFNEERTQPVTHHVVCKTRSSQCLKLLIDKFGPEFVTCRNDRDETVVHLIAQHQDDSWMELIPEPIVQQSLKVTAWKGRTVTHYAAMNDVSDSVLKLLVDKCGVDCLKSLDNDGNTALHLAAQYQGSDSMKLAKTVLGTDCFQSRGFSNRTVIHYAASNTSSHTSLKWLVVLCGTDCLKASDKDGYTAVHLAAQYQGIKSMELMKDALGTACFYPSKSSQEKTVFHCAASNRSSNASLKWLVQEFGSDCLTKFSDKFGNMPLHFVAEWQGADSMELMKKELGSSCFQLQGKSHKTSIHYAAANRESNESLKWLLNEYGPESLKVPDKDGNTAVHLAAQNQGVDSMELMKTKLGDACFEIKGKLRWTPVHFAATNLSSNASLKWLVKELGSDCLELPDKDGNTAIHLAARYQGIDSMKLMKEALGKDCFLLKGCLNRTAIHCAATNESSNQSLKWLLKGYSNRMPIHIAASSSEKLALFNWLIKECGPDCLKVPEKNGNTAVHLAAQYQGIESMKLIKKELGTGCFHLKGRLMRTPVHCAACNKFGYSVLKWLVLKCGPDCVAAVDKDGNTIVHLAAEHQSADLLQFLIDQIGPQVLSLKNNKGETLVECVEKDSDNDRKARKRNWIELTKDFESFYLEEGAVSVNAEATDDLLNQLRTALEARDDALLRRLCLLLNSNVELTVNDCLNKDRTQSVTHHVVCKSRSLQCLKLLISKFGPDCLLNRNNRGETAVHLTAMHQENLWMKLILEALGRDCFKDTASNGRMVTHYAATNETSNSSLKWLVAEFGRDCLLVPDKEGSTVVHLAAEYQGVDSMELMNRELETDCFKELKGSQNRTVVHYAAGNNISDAPLRWLVKNRAGGKPFREKWENKQLLGRGGFGDVHKVLTDTGVTCAAKTLRLPLQLGDQLDSKARKVDSVVESEKNLCQLQHPNIVRFLYITQPEPATVVVFMELLDGHTLENFIDEKPIDEEKIRHFSKQICSALLYLHSQQPPVIHRDINCTNIIVLADGTDRLKLIDFGLSIKLEQSVSHISASTSPKGTLNFMAPELLGDGESESVQYSRESDIWAFGCSVYQMAIGARPFATAKNLLQLVRLLDQNGAPLLQTGQQSCSQELLDFYSLCTAKDRKARISAEALMKHKFLTRSCD